MAKKTYLVEALRQASDTKGKIEKLKVVRDWANANASHRKQMQYFVECTFHPQVKWDLPEGTPPFKASVAPDISVAPQSYEKVHKQLHFFLNSARKIQNPVKREMKFIQLLESVHPSEAEMMVMMKNRKLEGFKGLTPKFFAEAFPEWLPAESPPKG